MNALSIKLYNKLLHRSTKHLLIILKEILNFWCRYTKNDEKMVAGSSTLFPTDVGYTFIFAVTLDLLRKPFTIVKDMRIQCFWTKTKTKVIINLYNCMDANGQYEPNIIL